MGKDKWTIVDEGVKKFQNGGSVHPYNGLERLKGKYSSYKLGEDEMSDRIVAGEGLDRESAVLQTRFGQMAGPSSGQRFYPPSNYFELEQASLRFPGSVYNKRSYTPDALPRIPLNRQLNPDLTPKQPVYSEYKNGGSVSQQGYRDDSPYRNRRSININTPNGIIDMSHTGTPLMANGKYLPPYSGQHQFNSTNVKEVPVKFQGGGSIWEVMPSDNTRTVLPTPQDTKLSISNETASQLSRSITQPLDNSYDQVITKINPLKIRDSRTMRRTTGLPIDPRRDLLSGTYDKDIIQGIIDSSIKNKVDAHTAIAIGLQESGLGKTDENIGHAIGNSHKFGRNKTDDLTATLAKKLALAKRLGKQSEEEQLQAYNGYGKIVPSTEASYHGYGMKKIYGVDIPKEGIDMSKNPLYGKQVLDIRDNIIKQNAVINHMVDSSYKANRKFQHGGKVTWSIQE